MENLISNIDFVEVFGYVSSLIVVFSLTRTSVKKLWIINGIGAVGFIIYALIIASYPTALMNLGALIIDIVQLYRLYHIHDSFETVDATPGSAYYNWFVKQHESDLKAYDENEAYKTAEHTLFFVRNNEVAGLLAYNVKGNKAEIVLDYVTDKFRDCRIGRYFFGNQNPHFIQQGIEELVTHTSNPKHEAYLKSLSFKQSEDGAWSKKLSASQSVMI